MAVPGGVTLLLAVWGAALSTFAVVRDSLRARPRGKVRVHFDMLPKSKPPEFGVYAVFSNVGREPIFLDRALLRAPTGRPGSWTENSISGDALPALYPGQSHTVTTKFRDVENLIDFLLDAPSEREQIDFRFRVLFFDQVGRQYSSPLMRLPTVRPMQGGGFEVRMPSDPRLSARLRRWVRAIRRKLTRFRAS